MKLAMGGLYLLLLSGLSACDAAARNAAFESGNYEGLLLAVSSDGQLTGRFEERAGLDGRITCSYALKGTANGSKASANINDGAGHLGVVSLAWTDKVIAFRLEGGGKFKCAPALGEWGSEWTLEQVQKLNWVEIRRIRSDRAYFHDAPTAAKVRRAFVVKNDVVGVVKSDGAWLSIEYLGDRGVSRGWIAESDTAAVDVTADTTGR